MRTLVLDPTPVELERLHERRRRTGADRHDEVWQGIYHMVPAPGGAHSLVAQQLAVLLDAPAREASLTVSADFNLGSEDDFRVPDLGVHRERPRGTWIPTAAIVVEIVSPHDETWAKLPFYVQHGVDELLIVDPTTHSIDWLVLLGSEYRPAGKSRIVDVSSEDLVAQLDWPDAEMSCGVPS